MVNWISWQEIRQRERYIDQTKTRRRIGLARTNLMHAKIIMPANSMLNMADTSNGFKLRCMVLCILFFLDNLAASVLLLFFGLGSMPVVV